MRRFLLLLGIPCLLWAQVSVIQTNFQGWTNSYILTKGEIRLVVVPAIGGRIMEYSLRGRSPIWINPTIKGGTVYPLRRDVWWNYGGYKTWNAPQFVWGWPPDPFLDAGGTSVEIIDGGIRVTGAPSFSTGIAFIKEITLTPEGRVKLVQKMRNISNREIRWSIWDVTQVSTPCFIVFPAQERSKFPQGLYFFDERSKQSKQWSIKGKLVIVQYKGETGKIGLDSTAGWMVYFQDRLAYVKIFPTFQGQEYPDEGCSVEVYTNEASLPYVEMEVLSPLVTLKPGEEFSFPEEWGIWLLRKPVRTETDIPDALRELILAGLLPWQGFKYIP